MIRVMYRWTVKPGDEEKFIADWKAGTGKIQANCAGAFGSFLIRSRSTPEHFFGVARWESGKAWTAAQPVMAGLNLPGPMPETAEFYDEIADIGPASSHKVSS
jgi:hypothetical protein